MKELHEGPLRGHFTTKITKKKYWMLDIGGQLCSEMCMITINHVKHVNEQEDWQLKFL